MTDDQIDAIHEKALVQFALTEGLTEAHARHMRSDTREIPDWRHIFALAVLRAAPEAAEPVATVHGVGWELDDAEVRVFGVPVRTWCRSFACTEPEREAGALADKINAAAKLAPTDSQAGRDAVEAAAERAIEHALETAGVLSSLGRALAVDAGMELFRTFSRGAASTTAGRTAE